MTSYRYLLNIAYMGKPFRGAQRQVKAEVPRPDDPLTVQGRLEMALKKLNPINDPAVLLSSRTDSGVHAMNSTCQVDLQKRIGFYEPSAVMVTVNKYFKRNELPIRILKTSIVPESFHCRYNAISRTYLYRLVIAKADTLNKAPNLNFLPIEEWDRCYFLCTNTFDLDRMRTAAKLFEGYHDFRSFMGKTLGGDERITRKNLEYIKINEINRTGYSTYSWPSFVESEATKYIFLDVYFKSEGFLYRQFFANKFDVARVPHIFENIGTFSLEGQKGDVKFIRMLWIFRDLSY